MDQQYMVCVGAPFDAQRFVGPFPDFSTADEWCSANLKQQEFTWIVSLSSPDADFYKEQSNGQ